MWHFVYVLKNDLGHQYVGHSDNVNIRLKQHNSGNVSATIDGRLWHIAWFCAFRTLREAILFEKYLKSGSGTMFRYRHLVKKG